MSVDTGEDKWHHLVDSHWAILDLLEEFCETLTSVEGLLSGGIKIGTELSEGSDFSILSQEKLERTSDLLHGLKLSS